MNSLSVEPDGYLLQRTAAEYQRLVMQAKVWEPATRRALELAGLAPGQSALDVGCGSCEAMRLMAERVGAGGRVTGVDIDAVLAAQALSVLRGQGPDVYRFVEADVTDLDSVRGASFDLVFARLLVFHMERPLAMLARMWRWVRPGGTLLVMDYDCSIGRPLAAQASFTRAIQLMNDAFRAGGRDIEIGARMPMLFVEAGIGTPDGCEVSGQIQPALPTTAMLRGVLGSLRQTITGAGLASAAELHRLDGDLAAAATEPIYGRWPDMVATWKRKQP